MSEHTHNQACILCPGKDGRPGRCDHDGYSKRYVRFLLAHREAFETAYLAGNGSSRNELERLRREYETLPPRHVCTCIQTNQRTGIREYHCLECRRLGEAIPRQDIAVEIGRSGSIEAPMPMVNMLDVNAGYA